ncbi:MAG TPA: DUF5339 domain-containing protein [Pseudoxanthomonas sp.]|nr:DUF5339 domain-containing protein [Pseudoxanthomonas sp.]
MKKLLIALALCTALSACNKDETAAPATTGNETPAAAPAAPAPAAPAPAAPAETIPPAADPAAAPGTTGDAATASTTLPPACEAYFKRAEACFTKAGAGGEAMKSAFEQSRSQMATMPAAQMEAGCTAANDAFAQTAAAMKCE